MQPGFVSQLDIACRIPVILGRLTSGRGLDAFELIESFQIARLPGIAQIVFQ